MAYASISKPSLHFNTKLYTGTGSSNAITGVGFQPDWVWIKSRSDGLSHALFDAVRGTTKVLNSNATTAEYTNADTLTAFGTDGFTVGSNTGVNANGETRVAWNWKANGQGSSNTTGTINTTYTSANTTSKFSIIKFTGNGTGSATIGHGLGTKPRIVMLKNLTDADSWIIWFDVNGSDTSNGRMSLNGSSAQETTANSMITVSDTLITLPSLVNAAWNGSSKDYIVYAFTNLNGFSKVGSYTGNGNNDGTFVYTGFKPSWIIIKRADSSDTWTIWDNKRLGYNGANNVLEADNTNAEASSDRLDILSNGFKLRYNWTPINSSGGTYYYLAFAEEPLVANVGQSIPATAR